MAIAAAFSDPTETALHVPDWSAIYAKRKEGREARAYKMFRNGSDTMQISHAFGIREATIHRWITMERCRGINAASPYGVKS